MTTDVGYNGITVCQVAGISYRQLDYWARTNLLRPSLQDARGSGTARRYTIGDIVLARLLALLLEQGISLQRGRHIIDQARRHLDRDVPGPLELADSGPVITVVDLPYVIADVHRRLAEVAPHAAERHGVHPMGAA